jgi:hypothetical protein
MKRFFALFIVLTALGAVLAACNLFEGQVQPSADPNMLVTYAAQTISARQTFGALETKIIELTKRPTQAPIIITATPPAASATPVPTRTLLPSQTAIPSATLAPSQTTAPTSAIPCNLARFVDDITIPDNTVIAPEASFTKTWRLQNRGSCTWTTGYALAFASGYQMSAPSTVKLTESVAPGEYTNLSVKLTAPKTTGSYTGYWHLRNPDGVTFGTGASGTAGFYVKIKVAVPTLSSLELFKGFCNAVWKNNGGDSLACPASAYDFSKGSVQVVDKPKLEIGYQDDEPALVLVPANGSNGAISGRYPKFTVKNGDRFKTVLGCLDGYEKCSVTFQLRYNDGSSEVSLGTWDQTYDGSYARVDIDLSSLKDKEIQLILIVNNKNGDSTGDAAFWLAPYIYRP